MDIIRFLKNWTLPVAIVSGMVIYLVFAFVPALDEASVLLEPFCKAVLPLFMFLVLFVTFCKVDFHRLKPVPWHFFVGLFQVLFVVLVVGSILLFHVTGNNLILLEAILTSIVCPCASACAVVTAKLGGSLEEVTTYTFISNIITASIVPVCFPMIDKAADISFIAALLLILRESFLVLLLPMIMAYVVKHYVRRLHRKIVSVKDLSYYLWGGSLVVVSGTTMRNIVHAETTVSFLCVIAVLAFLLCLIQFAVGRYVGHFFGRTVEAGQALGQKNTVFAIWIASNYLNPLSSIGPGCYILWQNIINSVEIWKKRVEDAKAEVEP